MVGLDRVDVAPKTVSTPGARLSVNWFLVAILALGAVYRFADLGLVRITYDNSYTIYDALRGLSGGGWPSMGQASSVFLPSPTLMTYVEALPLLVWRSPWSVAIFIIGLNTLAIACVYRAARKLLNQPAGYIAALLFAINPWVVYYSRETWVSSLMPLFVTLIAASLWPVLVDRPRASGGLLIAALTVTAMTQSYIASWGLLVTIGVLLILFRSSIPRRPFLIGLGVFVAGFIVYGLGLLSMWDSTLANLNKFLSGGNPSHFTREGIDHAVRFVTGMDFHAQYSDLTLGSGALTGLSQIAYAVLTLALLVGAGLAVRAIIQRRRERAAAGVLLVWYCVPVLLMTYTSHPVHPYYLLLSVPAGHVLAAWGLLPFVQRPIGRVVVGALVCGVAIVFGLNLHWFNVDAALHPTNPNLNGWTLESGVQVGNTISELTDYDPVSPRMVVDARPSLPGSLSGKNVRLISGLEYPNYVVLPGAGPLLYVLMNPTQKPDVLGPNAETFSDKALRFVDGAQVAFIRVKPYTRSAALALPETSVDWPSAAGLSLLGYTLNQPLVSGGDLELTTYWRVDELRPGYEQWFIGAYYQLLNQAGQQAANADGHSQYARRWQQGDVYVEHTHMALPNDLAAGDYALTIGLFDSNQGQAYPFVPAGGAQDNLSITVAIGASQ